MNTEEALKNIGIECMESSDCVDNEEYQNESGINSTSTYNMNDATTSDKQSTFPQLPLRSGRKTLNPDIMLAFTHCLATYKVSERDLEGICVDIANMVFQQKWTNSGDKEYNIQDPDYESDEELTKTTPLKSSSHSSTEPEPPKKKIKVKSDLTYVFPSRATRRKWLKDGALLNLRFVANKILHKEDDQVVTWRFDDTKKSAGHQLYDVKSNNITINSPEMKRETYTTGFTENLSHSGKDQAASIKHSLKLLSVLANETENDEDKVSVDDIICNIDFWMSDRSGDGSVALDELDIDEDKRLKCCGHTILCIDDAIDSYIGSVESSVGRDKLIGAEIGLKAVQSKHSIVTLGLIALCKGLSPSHAVLPYSLYMRYKQFREKNNLDSDSFKGFQANRFGRTSKMADKFLEHKECLIQFFDEVVDEQSNLLVQAMSTYIKSPWFELGCSVYSTFGHEIIQPICDILGIDDSGKVYRDDRNWHGVKQFYETKLQKLSEMSVESPSMTTREKLVSRCAQKVHENLQSQLDQVSFLQNEIPVANLSKLQYAPLTNSGCESKFAELDNRVKFSGGSSNLDTISDKQVVKYNRYLLQPKVIESAKEQFAWARGSKQAKEARKLQDEFLSQIKVMKSLSIKAKKEAKERKNRAVLKLLATCQQHGGPLTENTIDLVDKLTDKQLITEVSYLKKTLNANIKLKTKGPKDTTTGRFKFIPQTSDELRNSIRSVIKPEAAHSDMEFLLQQALI